MQGPHHPSTNQRTMLIRSASRVSSIHAKVKRKFSQRSAPRPSLSDGCPPPEVPKQDRISQYPPALTSPPSHPPPSSYITKATPSLSSSGTASSSTESPHQAAKTPLFRKRSRPVNSPPKMARSATKAMQNEDNTDDEIVKPSPSKPWPPFYNLHRPSELPVKVATKAEATPQQPVKRRRHSVRRSISKVSDMFLAPLLGHKRANEPQAPSVELTKEPPQIARLSFASDASTGTLGRYLAVRQINETYDSQFTIGMSIFAYECNGSWIREHEQKYQESYMCLDAHCEAHHGRMSLKAIRRRKAEEKVWFG